APYSGSDTPYRSQPALLALVETGVPELTGTAQAVRRSAARGIRTLVQ
ncbi:MAG: hypothetical protein ACI9KE_006673, partial [Polyangiales bacterium]